MNLWESQAAQSRCTVVRPMQKSIGKWEIRPPVKSLTPKNFNLKLCIRDYVGKMTHHAKFVSIGAVGASTQIGEMLPLCDFV